jgi:hypothetical protein
MKRDEVTAIAGSGLSTPGTAATQSQVAVGCGDSDLSVVWDLSRSSSARTAPPASCADSAARSLGALIRFEPCRKRPESILEFSKKLRETGRWLCLEDGNWWTWGRRLYTRLEKGAKAFGWKEK